MNKLFSIYEFYNKYDKRMWVIFFSRLIAVAGFSIVLPFISIYMHTELGIPMKIVGTIMMLSTGIGAISNIIGGELSDILGRKKIIVIAFFGRAITFVFLAYLVAIKADFVMLAIVLVISSFVGSLTMPASNAMIADIVEPSQRIEAFGFIRIGTNIGWAIGPFVGGILAMLSYSSLFLLTSMTSIVAGLLVLFLIKESPQMSEDQKFTYSDFVKITRDRVFLAFCFFGLLVWIVRGQLTVSLSIFSVDRILITKAQLGYLYTINGLIVVFFQYAATELTKKMRMTSALIIGSILYAIGFASVGFADSLLFLILSMTVITLGEITLAPASMALAVNLAPKNQRGRYLGVNGLFEHIGWSIAPFVGGFLLDFFPGKSISLWLIISFFGLGAALGYSWLRQEIDKKLDY